MNTSTERRRQARPNGLYKAIKKSGITPDAAHDLDARIRETVAAEVDTLRQEMKEMFKDVATKADIESLRAATKADMQALESRLLWHVLEGVAALLAIAAIIAGFVVYLLR